MASKARGTKRRGKAGSTRSSSDVVPNLVWSAARIGDLGLASGSRRSLPLGPERLRGSSRVHRAARSQERPPQNAGVLNCGARQDGASQQAGRARGRRRAGSACTRASSRAAGPRSCSWRRRAARGRSGSAP
eukprot:scaffold11645_cov60-Phaeocystis_antarctica.AAC.7